VALQLFPTASGWKREVVLQQWNVKRALSECKKWRLVEKSEKYMKSKKQSHLKWSVRHQWYSLNLFRNSQKSIRSFNSKVPLAVNRFSFKIRLLWFWNDVAVEIEAEQFREKMLKWCNENWKRMRIAQNWKENAKLSVRELRLRWMVGNGCVRKICFALKATIKIQSNRGGCRDN
jgi:hypothetical protein